MRWIVSLAILVVVAGCGVTNQSESAKTVAAFAVPLPSAADRDQFLLVLRAAADAEGMHVDAASRESLEKVAKVMPDSEMTLHAVVWRGSNDDEPIADAMDYRDHLGEVWIAFFKGEDPALATRFRERAIREIMLHWSGTLPLPIMPTGAIPLHRDLLRTPGGYVVKPSEARRYDVSDTKKEGP
ncbi:MAG: hypothetical protein WDO56_05130 [Gammaproteobacteria bacterium]